MEKYILKRYFDGKYYTPILHTKYKCMATQFTQKEYLRLSFSIQSTHELVKIY